MYEQIHIKHKLLQGSQHGVRRLGANGSSSSAATPPSYWLSPQAGGDTGHPINHPSPSNRQYLGAWYAVGASLVLSRCATCLQDAIAK